MMHWTLVLAPFLLLAALTLCIPPRPPPHSLQYRDIPVSTSGFSFRGICGTTTPSERLLAEHARLFSSAAHTISGDSTSRVGSVGESGSSLQNAAPIVVETWFHVVSSTAQADVVTDEMLAAQLEALLDAYANTTITFNLSGITRTINDTWARNDDDKGMKRFLRRGTYKTLNIYFQTDLQMTPYSGPAQPDSHTTTSLVRAAVTSESSSSSSSAPSVLGFCTLPDPAINSSSPLDDYILDGCNIHALTMPGGPWPGYSLGGTTIHEVGHWHGLLHTFQGESCQPDHPGDYIADTPVQASPTEGCPEGRDSCPDLPGLDPIHNFMDYSTDECYQGFTVNQAERMRDMWVRMREGK